MATPLDGMLDRWQQAGLIDAQQRRRIEEYESSSATAATLDGGRAIAPQSDRVARPSGTELLAYLGVLVALGGVLTLVYASGATLSLVAGLTLVLGVVALLATREFAGRDGAAMDRAAGACLALAAVALGVAAGEFAAAASLFTRTVSVDCAGGPCASIRSQDDSGNALLGAAVAVFVALALIRFVPGRLVALAAIVSAYTGAAELTGVLQLQKDTSAASIAFILLAVSAGLVLFGEIIRRRQPEAHGFFGFAAVLGATLPLYSLGGGDNVDLDVIGGLIAATAMAVGIALPRPGIAYAAVIGLAGLVIDIGARNFHTATSLGVYFSLCGVAAVVALVAVTRLLRSPSVARRSRPPE
jgi:hypothetical protein